MTLKYKLASGFAMTAFLASVVLPTGAFAASTNSITNNGADSVNKIKVKEVKKSKVKQSNSTAVFNIVGVLQNTGENKANKNNGGTTTVNSGSATATVTNTTTAGGNTANVEPCGCVEEGSNMNTISDNGADSTNTIKVVSKSSHVVKQSNEALIVNGVLVAQNTGGNSANKNNGGDTSVDSGDASATVTNTTEVNMNVINPSE